MSHECSSHGPDSRRDDLVCICFHVPGPKIVRYIQRERPRVVSLVSECLSAGTGCGWCIPFLEQIHEAVMAGGEPPPAMSGEEYRRRRKEYHRKLAAGDPNPRDITPRSTP